MKEGRVRIVDQKEPDEAKGSRTDKLSDGWMGSWLAIWRRSDTSRNSLWWFAARDPVNRVRNED
jgi:hypothetical protein